MRWILSRLKERSTWIAITTLAGLAGVNLAPELRELIVEAGIAIGGIILFATADKATNTTVVNNDPVTLVAKQTIASPELTEEQRASIDGP